MRYDSRFEERLHKGVLRKASFHTQIVEYEIKSRHKYHVDFTFVKNGIKYFIESKGRFRTRQESNKYLPIREAIRKLPGNNIFIFVFMKAGVPMPGAKRRKDGTKQSQEEWCEKQGFTWYTEDNINLLVN